MGTAKTLSILQAHISLRYVLRSTPCCSCEKYVCPIEGACLYLNKAVREVLSEEVTFKQGVKK